MKRQKRRAYRPRHPKRLRLQSAWLTPSVIRAFTNALEQMGRACLIYAAALRVVRHPHFPSGGRMRPASTSSGLGAEYIIVDDPFEAADLLKLTNCLNMLSDNESIRPAPAFPARIMWGGGIVSPPSSTTAE